MSQQAPVTGGDAADDQTGRFVVQPNGRPRPLSPHLQVWRFHVTMAASILHRITGGALVAGAVLVVLWLLALACGPQAYTVFLTFAASPLGLLVWFGLTVALFYHLAAGIRHLIWDTGAGLSVSGANLLSTLSLAFGVVGAVLFWIALFATGRVVL